MNARPTKLAVVLVATGATAALVLSSPVGADAARMITGKDIKNNSITSKDIKNRTLTASDFKAGQLPGTPGPAGAPGKDAARPTTVAFRADLPASTLGTGSALSRTAIVPAFSQVAGVDITSTTDLGAACGTDGYRIYAGLGASQDFLPLVYLDRDSDTAPLRSVGVVQTTGPLAQPLLVDVSCASSDHALPATSVTVTYTVAAQDTTPSVTYTGSTPVTADSARSRTTLGEVLDR